MKVIKFVFHATIKNNTVNTTISAFYANFLAPYAYLIKLHVFPANSIIFFTKIPVFYPIIVHKALLPTKILTSVHIAKYKGVKTALVSLNVLNVTLL